MVADTQRGPQSRLNPRRHRSTRGDIGEAKRREGGLRADEESWKASQVGSVEGKDGAQRRTFLSWTPMTPPGDTHKQLHLTGKGMEA